MDKKKSSCPRIFALFEKRIDGDDALLDLARLRFREAHIAPEFYASSIEELNRLLEFNPFPDKQAAVHLPRGLDLFAQSARDLTVEFARKFAGRVFGFTCHDQKEIETRFDDYVNALRELENELSSIQGRPFLFVEYAAGIDPGRFVSLFEKIRDLKGISACLDIGHIGLRQAQTFFSAGHPEKNIFSLTGDPSLPSLMDDVQAAVNSGREEVLRIIGGFGQIGKPVHLHLHDAHPLVMPKMFGNSDHLGFLDHIDLPFEYRGKKELTLMFGPRGLLGIATESLSRLGPENVSFSLEIHPGEGRLPLGSASYLFAHWADKGNAERMNFWLSRLSENYRLLRSSCAKSEKGAPAKMIIYNIFPLLAGKLRAWEPHLLRASQMGFNWIFVNPIQKTGKSGSIYSISDYFSFNPLLIEEGADKPPGEQVREMLRVAENLGLHVMVDLVINHCSVDADIIRTHPEWFLWEPDGKVANPFADENGKKVVWKDLAKFDHRNTKDREGLIRFFLDVIEFLADLGFRGFRCDAAYQIPKDMWQRLIKETRKKYPDVLFFAETLGCPPDLTRKTASAGFDYIFNSSKWWDFKSPWLMEQYALTRDIAPSISFPESHDTVRVCEELKGNIEGIKQRYFFAALFSSGVMMPIGFEFCFRKKLNVVRTRPEDWEDTGRDLISFISGVNAIKSEYEIFSEDAPTHIIHHQNENVLLMWKASVNTPEESLIVLNKDAGQGQHFSVESLHKMIQAGGPLADISPGERMDFIPSPFSYQLRPGQGMVLITSRDFEAEIVR